MYNHVDQSHDQLKCACVVLRVTNIYQKAMRIQMYYKVYPSGPRAEKLNERN